jgi:molecular chaperone GrpE
MKEQETESTTSAQAENVQDPITDAPIQDPGHELDPADHQPQAELEAALAEQKDKYLRLFAEFENFRKRTARERIELIETASHDLMVRLLPILDDFDRAFKAMEPEKETHQALFNGVELIKNKLNDTLRAKGLVVMEPSTGQPFDVETMEAITRIPAPDDTMKGKVIDEVERGYKLGNKIIRYAKVVVGE